ncbi:MAG: Microbacterium phage OneinaGillian, partial [Actinomycetota bacterium]
MGVAYERFIEALGANGFRFQANGTYRGRAQCPAHNGSDMNLSVADGDQGVLVKCHSYDCPSEDIAKALGLTLEDLFDQDGRAVYDYGNGHRVTRRRTRDGKKIYQDQKPVVTTLYRHPRSAPIETSDVVVLVEGEKCVDAALHLGESCVTTWPGGAAGVAQVDITPLAGKTIRIIADNDEAGKRAAVRLSARLAGLAT